MLVPTFADRGCRLVSATDPQGYILGFHDRSHYYFFQVAPQLYSRGWVDHVPDPLLRKSGSTWNQTQDLWICIKELWPLDHRGGPDDSMTRNNVLVKNMDLGSSSNPKLQSAVAGLNWIRKVTWFEQHTALKFAACWPHAAHQLLCAALDGVLHFSKI
jgi:hypothetical protein